MQCRYLVTSYAVAASPPLNFATTSDAALLSANYGAAFALGRLIAIPASARFSSLSLMVVSVALSIASLWALVASPDSSSTLQVSTIPSYPTICARACVRVCVCANYDDHALTRYYLLLLDEYRARRPRSG